MEVLEEVVTNFEGQEWIMEVDLGDKGYRTEDEIFNAGLCGSGHRDGISIAAETGGQPQNVDFGNRFGIPGCLPTVRRERHDSHILSNQRTPGVSQFRLH
jgi:hypothetical protein